MKPILVKVRIEPAACIKKEFVAYTNYDVMGQGDFQSVKNSARSVIRNHLDAFACRGRELPLPNQNFLVKGYTLEERVERQYEGLPPLIFEFYR